MSALSTRPTRGELSASTSQHCLTTAMHSSHSPSMVVNIASVRCGRPESRTTRMARATASDTEPVSSAATVGETEKAISMPSPYAAPHVLARPPAPAAGSERLRHRERFLDDLEPQVLIDLHHPGVLLVVHRLHRAALRGKTVQLTEVGGLDRHAEPVAAV